MKYRAVKGIEDLRALANGRPLWAAIALAGGLAMSVKTITWARDLRVWVVKNHIDETRQTLTDAELWTASNIGEALDKRALIVVDKP